MRRSPLLDGRCLATVVLLALPLAAWAAKPEASFALVDGWIEMRITKDGRPLEGVKLQVFDVIGAPFAQGETGAEGVGSFPRPNSLTCRVAVTLEEKECDSILLLFDGKTNVRPDRVQLTFADGSCCLPAPDRPARSLWTAWVEEGVLWYGAVGLACCVAAGGVSLRLWQRTRMRSQHVDPAS